MRPPGSGRCTPEMILISVDLPDPFSPTRQWTSPAARREVDVAQRDDAAESAWRSGSEVEEVGQGPDAQRPPAIRPSIVSLLIRMILSTLISLPGTSTDALPRPGISTPSLISLPSSTSLATATMA